MLAGAPAAAQIAVAVLAIALLVSVVTDLRERRILNAITFPALAIVAACAMWLEGTALLAEAGLGALICAAPLSFAAWRGWMGGGDVKLIAVSGAAAGMLNGWPLAVAVLVDVAVAGGIVAAVSIAAAKARGRRAPRHIPYSLAIAAGTAIAFVFG